VRPIDDLKDLTPVVRQISGAPQNAEVDQTLESPSSPRPGPPKANRHEFNEGPFARDPTCEVDLHRGGDEGQFLSLLRFFDFEQDGPQTSWPTHIIWMREAIRLPCACT
jgi:hypothetical protein